MATAEILEEGGPLIDKIAEGSGEASRLPVLYNNKLPGAVAGEVTSSATKTLDALPIATKGRGFIGFWKSRSRLGKFAILAGGGLGLAALGGKIYSSMIGKNHVDTDNLDEGDLGVSYEEPTAAMQLSTKEFLVRAINYLNMLTNEDLLPSARKEAMLGSLINLNLWSVSQKSSDMYENFLTASRLLGVLTRYGWTPEMWDTPKLLVPVVDRMSEQLGSSMDVEGMIFVINNLNTLNIEKA